MSADVLRKSRGSGEHAITLIYNDLVAYIQSRVDDDELPTILHLVRTLYLFQWYWYIFIWDQWLYPRQAVSTHSRRGESTYVFEAVWTFHPTSIDGRSTICGHTFRDQCLHRFYSNLWSSCRFYHDFCEYFVLISASRLIVHNFCRSVLLMTCCVHHLV